MLYEWDENKRLSNLKKHGLDFTDAHYIFEDPQAVSFENTSKDFGEHRFITIGYYKKEFCLVVVIHTDKKEKKCIISLRKASKEERELYYDNRTIHRKRA